MVQLKKAGKLELAFDNTFQNLINKPGYEVLRAAINEEKHVKFIIDYFNKPAKEIKKSIKSYEKQIAVHRDKIANPSKHIPHWNGLHPERKESLINKKWPSEIECFTEKRDILQTILNQRIEKLINLWIMKNQAFAFDIDQEEIGLADIEPERDLL